MSKSKFSYKIFFSVLLSIGLLYYIYMFLSDIMSRSIQQETRTISTKDIEAETDIYKNMQGVLHIVSASDSDIFFALGYAHAENHLWQMFLNKKILQGEISEIFGKQYLETDYFMRAIGIKDIAKKLFEAADEETKNILRKYSDGVNTYIENNLAKYSFEFDATDCEPDEWLPQDCFAIQRYWAFLTSYGFSYDILLSEIEMKVGYKNLVELIPTYPSDAPHILDDTTRIFFKADTKIGEKKSKKRGNFSEVFGKLNEIYKLINKNDNLFGSNSWVVNKKKNNKIANNSVLANDLHSSVNVPTLFMQVHISSPNYNVVGLTLPGMPIFLCGRNDDIAWGFTNMRLDDVDFFVEKITDDNKRYFVDEVKTKVIDECLDTIKIKNAEEKVFYMRNTERSRIISDFQVITGKKQKEIFNKVLTFKWTGSEISNEISAGLKIMQAKSWNNFKQAINKWSVPGVNFSFTDRKGNLGVAPRGLIPKRGIAVKPFVISEAWTQNSSWEGFYPPDDLGDSYNPKKKFIISANNAVKRNIENYVSVYFASPVRAERIEEFLNRGKFYTVKDAQYMQNDVLSLYANKQLDIILPILHKYLHLLNEKEKKAYYKLKQWDCVMNPSSTASAIYNVFLTYLCKNTLQDELEEYHYQLYSKISDFLLQKIDELLKNPHHIYFDNIKTKEFENMDYIIVTSFQDAMKYLTKLFKNDNSDTWKYGKMNVLEIKPLFFNQTEIDKQINEILTIGEFEIGGDPTTINTVIKDEKTNYVKNAAVARFIADMSDSVVYSILPGGNSGDAMSSNYSDQIRFWKIGAYLQIPVSSQINDDFTLHMKFVRNN